jgi:acetyl esterase/lipase
MAYFVAVVSVWLIFSAMTALRPSRRGIFAALAFPVGWAAGELPVQAIVGEGVLLGILKWWGWPRTHALGLVVLILAGVVLLENLELVFAQLHSRRVVRRAMAEAPRRPLQVGRPRDDAFASWWRTALQIPFHPRDMQLVRNIAYGPAKRHRLDVWRMSTTPSNAPVIFYIHGGTWMYGDKREQGRPMMHEFVRRGWICVSCNYRLAPKNPWPAQIEDALRTLAWIKKYIANYGGDPERVIVSGGSAGGQLAALLALTTDDPTWRPRDVSGVTDWSVRGCMSFYGVLEMTGDETHWHGLGRGLRLVLERAIVQQTYATNPTLFENMSPYHRITQYAPPFLVVHGRNDTLVDYHVASDFVEKFRRVALAPAYYIELPFTQHTFDMTASPRTSAAVRAAVAFAESVAPPMPNVVPETWQHYQVPPTKLEVEVAPETWGDAILAAHDYGPYRIVSADNPYSQVLDPEENARRYNELRGLLDTHNIQYRRSVAIDPSGKWPDEEGFALFGVSDEFAKRLGVTFDQFAYYYVDDTEALVVPCRARDASLIRESHHN